MLIEVALTPSGNGLYLNLRINSRWAYASSEGRLRVPDLLHLSTIFVTGNRAEGYFYSPRINLLSTKSKLRRDLVQSSEADYAF